MSDVPIRTWKDFLFPNGINTRISLLRVDNTAGLTTSTSVFSPAEWELSRLPSHLHLVEGLLSRMHDDLNRILEEHYAIQAGRTSVMVRFSRRRLTPDNLLETLREDFARLNFRINYESDAEAMAGYVFRLVANIHYALTETIPEFRNQQPTDCSVVVTDDFYKFDGAIESRGSGINP